MKKLILAAALIFLFSSQSHAAYNAPTGLSYDCGHGSIAGKSDSGQFSYNNCAFSSLFTATGTGVAHRVFQADTFSNGLTISA